MGNDGQHRGGTGSGAPGEKRGQTSIVRPGAHVGNANGPDANMGVGTTSKDDDISTTTGSAGPLAPGEKPGADD